MTLKEFVSKKAEEIRAKSDELDKKYKNNLSVDALRDYARNNGKYELINEIMFFVAQNNL